LPYLKVRTMGMRKSKPVISVLVPCYNASEEEVLATVARTEKYFAKRPFTLEFIISQNGDASPLNLPRRIKHLYNHEKGMGVAYRAAFKEARGEYFYTLPVDIAFNFSDLDQILNYYHQYDLVVASKLHPNSIYQISVIRKIASKVLRIIIKLLFQDFRINDPTGIYFGKVAIFSKIAKKTSHPGFFFAVEMAFHASRLPISIHEVPVIYVKNNSTTSVKLGREGINFIIELIKLRFRN
jgi:glycosyltransferase involved in cell wall biosynthesis